MECYAREFVVCVLLLYITKQNPLFELDKGAPCNISSLGAQCTSALFYDGETARQTVTSVLLIKNIIILQLKLTWIVRRGTGPRAPGDRCPLRARPGARAPPGRG